MLATIYAMDGYIDMATGSTDGLRHICTLGRDSFCALICWCQGAVDCLERRKA